MKTEIAFLVFVAVSMGCIHSSPGETSGESERGVETNTVYYTSTGFQPDTVRVEQGETVTWINNASSPMWVGSDQHPSHTEYAGTSLREHCGNGNNNAFDQCESGERFSFTFQKTGEWGYHNHESPGDTGTVIVE